MTAKKKPTVQFTVEYGGSYYLKSNAFRAQEGPLRDKSEARVSKEAAGRPILREPDRPYLDRCLWLGAVVEETADYVIFEEDGFQQRASRDLVEGLHVEPCPRWSDYDEAGL